MAIALVMSSSHLILCRPLILPPSIFPSIRVFSNELVLHIRHPKYWSFSFSVSLSNAYSGLISFKIDWLNLLAVQGTLKSLLWPHSSKASILQHSAFFIVQLSHPYMTAGKTVALTRWTFVGKVMSLLFNMLPGLVIAFLPRIKHLLISWLQSPSAVILEPKKKVCHCFHCFPIYLPWSDGLNAMISIFQMLSFTLSMLYLKFHLESILLDLFYIEHLHLNWWLIFYSLFTISNLFSVCLVSNQFLFLFSCLPVGYMNTLRFHL